MGADVDEDGVVGSAGDASVVDGGRDSADGGVADLVVGNDQQRRVHVRGRPAPRACRSPSAASRPLTAHVNVSSLDVFLNMFE